MEGIRRVLNTMFLFWAVSSIRTERIKAEVIALRGQVWYKPLWISWGLMLLLKTRPASSKDRKQAAWKPQDVATHDDHRQIRGPAATRNIPNDNYIYTHFKAILSALNVNRERTFPKNVQISPNLSDWREPWRVENEFFQGTALTSAHNRSC